jgi:hypothetical protein
MIGMAAMSAQLAIVTVAGMRRLVCMVTLLGASLGACSGDPTSDIAATTAPETAAPPTVIALDTALDLPDSTLAPEPTGVPGIDDPDPFCAAWAVFAGSVQALAVAAAFGELESDQMAALELRAAPAMVASAASIGATFPASLAAEREAVMDKVLGPSSRRASRGVDELTAVGVDPEGVESIRDDWLRALATRPGDDPLIVLSALGEPLDDLVTVASRNFDAGVTPYAQDPSLMVSDVPTPLTDAYLAEICPAVASSGVGDSL